MNTDLTTATPAPAPEPRWLSVQEAAARWRCSPRTVERHVQRLGLAPLRLGRVVRVDVLAVERAAAAQVRP